MSDIFILTAADGQCCGYEILGHAGFAKAGQDIVCAALSFLSITCANALESVAGIVPGITQAEGRLQVVVPPSKSNHDARVIFRLFCQGARDLQQSYPDHVRVIDSCLFKETEEELP